MEANNDPRANEFSEIYTLADFDYQTDINFQGVDPERVFGITFPQNWSFTDPALLTVYFSHSDLLHPESSLYVEWNGERVGTVLLTEENIQKGSLEISIPSEKLIRGYNALKIGFFMGISDDFCTDYKNQGVWAVVHNTTSINISGQISPVEAELYDAPDIFVDSSLLADNLVTLLLPESLTLQHLNALVVMSTKLGQMADWRNIQVQLMTVKEAKKAKPSGNLILFASLDEVDDLSGDLIPEIEGIFEQYASHSPLGDDDGIISLQTSPFDSDYHILTLTGKTLDAMEKSTRAAAYDELYQQSNGSWAVVRNLTGIIERVSNPLEVSFAELGYTDQAVSGTLEQTVQYNLPISALWTVDSEAWIDLYFTHSELISQESSSVTVMVNSIPIASFELNSGNAEDGYKEIRIPLRYINVGENVIAFKVKMQFSEDSILMLDSCSPEATPRAWLNILAESTVRLPNLSKQLSFNLSTFPFGYSDPFTYEGFTYGVPSSIDLIGLNGLTNIAVTFGKATLGNPAAIDLVLIGDDLSQFDNYGYVVMVGTIETMINESLNAILPVTFDPESGLPQDNPSLMIVETASGVQAFLEAFQKGQSASYLVITANDAQGVATAGEFLANPSVRYELNGNVAIVTSPDHASAYQVDPSETSTGDSPQIINDNPIAVLSNQSIWVVRVAIGIAVLSMFVILIALLFKNSSKKES